MRMRILTIAVVCLPLLACTARAATVSFEYEGVITGIGASSYSSSMGYTDRSEDFKAILLGLIEVGDPFTGRVTYDLSVPDTDPSSDERGYYDHTGVGVHELIWNIGANTFREDADFRVQVTNRDPLL